eukprot:421917_1
MSIEIMEESESKQHWGILMDSMSNPHKTNQAESCWIANITVDLTTTEPTLEPTYYPSFAPTKVSPLIKNTHLLNECDFDNSYCFDFALSKTFKESSSDCNDVCVQSGDVYQGINILFDLNLANSIFEMVAFLIDILLLCPLQKNKYKAQIFYTLFITQIIVILIDIPLEIASGAIVIDYKLLDRLDELYRNQCFSRFADYNITEMITNVEQILTFSWLEAFISIVLLVVCFFKVRNWKNHIEEKVAINRILFYFSVFCALIDLTLAALNFILFTRPTYKNYGELYDSLLVGDEQG